MSSGWAESAERINELHVCIGTWDDNLRFPLITALAVHPVVAQAVEAYVREVRQPVVL